MRIPTSTYRLQIAPDFTLFDAAQRVPYLHGLGIDWVYLSPILQAVEGSTHGYDVTDHRQIDRARGGADGLRALSDAARAHGMGVLVDIVPNHVGVAVPHENQAWWDLLTHGQRSAYAHWFDVDWEFGGGRVRIPVVGDDDLVDGQIANLAVVEGELRYHDRRFPIAPGTLGGTANDVHARQSYELMHWRRADHDLNYRRFFGINDLAAVRVEDPDVFDATHVEIARWFDEGLVDGLRIDHPDGLRDPIGYVARLRERIGGALIVIEKILEPGEQLGAWRCEGTTGYDTLALIDRLLVDPAGETGLTALDTELRQGAPLQWAELIHQTKRDIVDHTLASEVRRIVREVPEAADIADTAVICDAVAELLTCFPVYRSYLPHGTEYLAEAASEAARRRPMLELVIDRLVAVLREPENPAAQRFQQTSGMVMAKGVEDTAFYRYGRLTSLNEVGADPSIFSVTVDDFHEAMQQRMAEWPNAMNALSTHDTKRSEDVRARITALSETPDMWADFVRRHADRLPGSDPALANLILQAVFGAHTAGGDRLHAYAVKAAREAATVTRWTAPHAGVEAAFGDLIDDAYADPKLADVLSATEEAWKRNVLVMKLLNLTIPGFPDIYQGTEVIDDSLVDPDNRRPIDWAAMPAPSELDDSLTALKGRLIRAVLALRKNRPELFAGYAPVPVVGSDRVIAFDRGGVLPIAALAGWRTPASVTLPPGSWVDEFGGAEALEGVVQLSELLDARPVALLVRQEHS